MSIYLYGSCECTPKVILFGALNEDNLGPKDYFEIIVLGNTPITKCPKCNKEIELKVKEGKQNV